MARFNIWMVLLAMVLQMGSHSVVAEEKVYPAKDEDIDKLSEIIKKHRSQKPELLKKDTTRELKKPKGENGIIPINKRAQFIDADFIEAQEVLKTDQINKESKPRSEKRDKPKFYKEQSNLQKRRALKDKLDKKRERRRKFQERDHHRNKLGLPPTLPPPPP